MKKVAVESRVAQTNEYVTRLELLAKFGPGVYSPDTLNYEKLKVFQIMSRRTVFEDSTAVADLAQDSSDESDSSEEQQVETTTHHEVETGNVAEEDDGVDPDTDDDPEPPPFVAATIMPHAPRRATRSTRSMAAVRCHQSSEDEDDSV